MFSGNKRVIVGLSWLFCFSIGSFFWKIYNTGGFFQKNSQEISGEENLNFSVYVGDYLITKRDVEWEYSFYVDDIDKIEKGENKSTVKMKASEVNEMAEGKRPITELYNKIMGDLIERKLLFQFIKKDIQFDLDNPGRYTSCLADWKKSLNQRPPYESKVKSSALLKSMLCEKDILHQYMSERLQSKLKPSESELQQYFASHKDMFTQPEKVVIRHILLTSESDARRVQGKLTSSNFASIVKEFSIAPEAAEGGLIGPFAKGEMPSLFDLCFDMGVGEIRGIIKSPYGFHIIMLEKKTPKRAALFEVARHQVERAVLKIKKEEEYTKWVEAALNSIPIRSSRNL